MLNERANWKINWVIDKFKDIDGSVEKEIKENDSVELLKNTDRYIGTEHIYGNMLINTGINEIWDLIVGDSANHFNNAGATIGVGDSATAAQATDTDLIGSNKTYKAMEATYPLTTSQQAIFRSVFGSSDANYAWNEFVIKQATSAVCMNRKVEAKGTKASGETWTITVTITLS